ncbi:hypothetical protein J6590_070050 [Homalodisca vitripennis]|nr:hypothetical protein J6590_070050 [Homalodisca vitripennis]
MKHWHNRHILRPSAAYSSTCTANSRPGFELHHTPPNYRHFNVTHKLLSLSENATRRDTHTTRREDVGISNVAIKKDIGARLAIIEIPILLNTCGARRLATTLYVTLITDIVAFWNTQI